MRLDDRVVALNVARDDIAAVELVDMGHELRELHARDPLGVVDVLDIKPDVLACAWIDGMELHVVDRGDGRGLFIAVEESVSRRQRPSADADRPGGRPASDAIWASWLEALVRQTTLDERGKLSRPRVDACDGDLVLLNEQPVLVSLSPGPVVRDRGLGARPARPALRAIATPRCAGATAPQRARHSTARSRCTAIPRATVHARADIAVAFDTKC